MEAAGCCVALVPVCQTMWYYNLEDHNLKVTDGMFLVHPNTGRQFHFNIISGTVFTKHVFP
jgi:hypothetical protein